jgi:hypothetical protein
MNFLEHTLDTLSDYGKNIDDIEWIGNEFMYLTWDEFIELSEEIEDFSSDGLGPIPQDLKIVGKTWWMDLEGCTSIEDDEQVEWVYREKPKRPHITEFNDVVDQLIAYNEIADFKITLGELE